MGGSFPIQKKLSQIFINDIFGHAFPGKSTMKNSENEGRGVIFRGEQGWLLDFWKRSQILGTEIKTASPTFGTLSTINYVPALIIFITVRLRLPKYSLNEDDICSSAHWKPMRKYKTEHPPRPKIMLITKRFSSLISISTEMLTPQSISISIQN